MTQPHSIKIKIATLMSDHRERTVSDISLKVGASSQAVSKALGDMKRAGLLSGERLDGATIWRSAV